MKSILAILLSVCLIVIIIILLVKIDSLNQKNIFFHNKMIEYEYLRLLMNEANFDKQYFKKKWPDEFNKTSGSLILSPDKVLSDNFFKRHSYAAGETDFFGYELVFDQDGILRNYSFYKP